MTEQCDFFADPKISEICSSNYELFHSVQDGSSQISFAEEMGLGPEEANGRIDNDIDGFFDNKDELQERSDSESPGEESSSKCSKTKIIKKVGEKKVKAKKNDYKKNICGYITKKIVREFTEDTYSDRLAPLCSQENISLKSCQIYYQALMERITGPSHLDLLFKSQEVEERKCIRVFKKFFEWFLKERYVRYLLTEGKMENKEMYIRYKNESLYHLFMERRQDE